MPRHKPRSITRANRKKGGTKEGEEKLTIRSRYGYSDPTPYFALNHIERNKKAASS